ncbi:hypothetical protein O5264_29785, partial [Escherichia coli]|nr:hypothetical protein [Escherichia coli]
SVNLSALQLMHPNMVADMLELLTEALSEKLPTLRLLTRSAEVIQIQAHRLQAPLAAHYGAEFAVEVMPCLSQIGSG